MTGKENENEESNENHVQKSQSQSKKPTTILAKTPATLTTQRNTECRKIDRHIRELTRPTMTSAVSMDETHLPPHHRHRRRSAVLSRERHKSQTSIQMKDIVDTEKP